jgi:hypothetical protein
MSSCLAGGFRLDDDVVEVKPRDVINVSNWARDSQKSSTRQALSVGGEP